MIQWKDVESDFKIDGSLRDVYITPATIGDWQKTLDVVQLLPSLKFSVDQRQEQLPSSVDAIFLLRREGHHPMLAVTVGRTGVVFHFFSEQEVECDIDPREFCSQEDLDIFLNFVRRLGDCVGKVVNVTHENMRDRRIITYEPSSKQFKYHPSAT